jgi:hypothetical protein
MNALRPDLAAVLSLPCLPATPPRRPSADWLIHPAGFVARAYQTAGGAEVVLTNGLLARTWRLTPGAATVGFDNLMTGESILRSVRPEARVRLDGVDYPVGGLSGLSEHAYLRRDWVPALTPTPGSLALARVDLGPTQAPFAWGRRRTAPPLPWPPPGVRLTLTFAPPPALPGVIVRVLCELYDGIPLLAKWLEIDPGPERPVRLHRFAAEILAVVEYDSQVDSAGPPRYPNLHVESDYAYRDVDAAHPRRTTCWEPDPEYTTQVNYLYQTPCRLESRPPRGPDLTLSPGVSFTTFRTFELVHDSTERERQGLALRRLYRTAAPWTQENPILMHVRQADPEAVRRAIDQCAEVGFEMVIMTFGSGFDPENDDPAYVAQVRDLADYAHARGVELGGYSLLASRRIDDEQDTINPTTGRPGGAVFGHSPCLCSQWGRQYFARLQAFFAATGLDVLEHDGSYPGDWCASTRHPDHEGLDDSQWRQWRRIADFYQWCRATGIYLNVPDWYFLAGANKTAMGYREVNWSLPRERQLLLGRQNIHDGTWEKTPSLGWMFVPLVEYQGGGAAATLEPLADHLDAYEAHLAQNFGAGVQACYRGPRLFDTDATRAVVRRWVDFYRAHRAILDADLIHVRRPDGRDLDCFLHVDAQLPERGLAMVFNPLDHAVHRDLELPLYYTGLTTAVQVREQEGPPQLRPLDARQWLTLPVQLPARGRTWFVFAAPPA